MKRFGSRSAIRLASLSALLALALAACAAPDTPSTTTTTTSAAGSPAAPASGAASVAASVAAAEAQAGAAGDDNDCANVQSDLKIGFDTSLTGGTADLGEGHRKGFKLALKEYNAAGGYQGKKVQCIILDDATKPAQGLANLTRLIAQDKVFGVVAFTNTGIAVPAAKQVNDAKIPLIVPVSTGTAVTAQFAGQTGTYVFRVSMADVNQVQVMLGQLDKLGVSKPAIMHDVTGYGTLGAEDITKALAARNQTPISNQSFQQGDTDMTGQLNAAKSAGADVIMTYALAPELANLLKSMDKIGWYPPIVGSWTLAQPDMVKFATPDIVKKFKIYMVQSFTIDRDEASKAFNDKIEAEYGKGQNLVPITAAQGYDATNMMLSALTKVGPDPVKLRDAIEGITDFKGVTTAPATPFTPEDHEAIEQKDMFIGTWVDNGGTLQIGKAQ